MHASHAPRRPGSTSCCWHCLDRVLPSAVQLMLLPAWCRWVMHWLAQQPRFQGSQFVSVTTNLMSFGTSGLEGAMQGSKQVWRCSPPCMPSHQHALSSMRQQSLHLHLQGAAATLPAFMLLLAPCRASAQVQHAITGCCSASQAAAVHHRLLQCITGCCSASQAAAVHTAGPCSSYARHRCRRQQQSAMRPSRCCTCRRLATT
jgi:hypothetical protein